MTLAGYGEIEIGLHRSQPEAYEVELRVTDPGTDAEVAPVRGEARISLNELARLCDLPDAYGARLAADLFSDPAIREFWLENKASLESRGLMLRLRVSIGLSAPELQGLRWELLCDPKTKAPLATSERILFSRFMLSRDWRVVKLRPKSQLKALIAIAAPSDIVDWRMAEVDYAGEVSRAREGLAGIDAITCAQPVTLERLIEGIRRGVDIVYLVCHGAIPKGEEPCLYLQNDEGGTEVVLASVLARRIQELQQAPRLIVLASCESAAALAPRLAEAGVPAVLAMQDRISMETVKRAMPVFFRELLRDGQIDRAMAVARGAVRDEPDHWMPALFLRLKSGRIWYEPGFAGKFEKWPAICAQVRAGKFVPILGPELGESVFGGTRELAHKLAERHAFPLEEHERSDLAKVSQFIATNQDSRYVHTALQNQFLRQLVARLKPAPGKDVPIPELLDLAARQCLAEPDQPYRILAELKAPLYVNASYETLLSRSLRAEGQKPELVSCAWRADPLDTDEAHGEAAVPRKPEPETEPEAGTPWVYHVFGHFGNPATMVLTEDDFFDYLIATSQLNLMLPRLMGRLVQNSLLFLGFRLDDWRFRVLLRMILNQGGKGTLQGFSHVGVQVNPDEHGLADVERARKYMEKYFEGKKNNAPEISLYWGSPAEFLKELKRHLAETREEEPPVLAAAGGGDEHWF